MSFYTHSTSVSSCFPSYKNPCQPSESAHTLTLAHTVVMLLSWHTWVEHFHHNTHGLFLPQHAKAFVIRRPLKVRTLVKFGIFTLLPLPSVFLLYSHSVQRARHRSVIILRNTAFTSHWNEKRKFFFNESDLCSCLMAFSSSLAGLNIYSSVNSI